MTPVHLNQAKVLSLIFIHEEKKREGSATVVGQVFILTGVDAFTSSDSPTSVYYTTCR